MNNYTKKNPPLNQWASLVERSIHELGTVEWKEANISNLLISIIHDCGYWGNIDYIFPEPSEVNNWLCDSDNKFCSGWFIAQYEGLYGSWSPSYAYRSHSFHISTDPKGETYYTAGDPPQFLINNFANRGIEVVLWDKSLSKDHPLLQKAKSECESLNLPFNKSVATRIWNRSTPDTFIAEWEKRKADYFKEEIKRLYGKEALKVLAEKQELKEDIGKLHKREELKNEECEKLLREKIKELYGDEAGTYIENKNRGGLINCKGNIYENFFAVYQIAFLSKNVIEEEKIIQFSSQRVAFVDDLIIDCQNASLQYFQLKSGLDVKWGRELRSIADDFQKQHELSQAMLSRESAMFLVVSEQDLRNNLNTNMPDTIKAFSHVLCFYYDADLSRAIQKNIPFYQALEYLAASPNLDKLECVALALLGAWVGSDKSSISVMEVLKKAKRLESSFIRSFNQDLKLEPKVERVLNAIGGFSYCLKQGFLHWSFQNKLFEGILSYSIETDGFRRFQERVKKYSPTTFAELWILL